MNLIRSNRDFNGRKVLVMGLGTKNGGVWSAIYCHRNNATVTITDLNDSSKLRDSLKKIEKYPFELKLGRHDEADFLNADIIIKNPGIKRTNHFLNIAEAENKIIDTPAGIFSEVHKRPYIGITGTKGKSYTTFLTSHLLSSLGLKSVAAGNNCVSPLEHTGKELRFVMELSSWQLHELNLHKKSPQVACWLNFFPDHMNYYANKDDYFEDKHNIAKHQSEEDFLILPFGEDFTEGIVTNARRVYFSHRYNTGDADGCFIADGMIHIRGNGIKTGIIPVSELPEEFIPHQHLALLLASLCSVYFYIKRCNLNLFDTAKIVQAIRSFEGVPHRFETIYKDDRYMVINDSSASTPESVLYALQNELRQPVALMMGGGHHKNLSFEKVIAQIIKKNIKVLLLKDDLTSDILREHFNKAGYADFVTETSFRSAVEKAYSLLTSNKEGTILLSPGCSGSPYFTDMFERGDRFRKYIAEIISDQNL